MAEPLDFSAFGIPADDETGAPAQGVLDFSAEGEAADAVDTVPIPQPKPTRAPFEPPQPQTAIAPPQERKPMAPGATRPRPTLTRDMQKHVKDMKLINGEWYSRNDLGIIAHFDESGIPDQVTGDPEILKHFGQSKPTKAAALALKNQEAGLINQPKDKATTVQKYTQEASKAFGKGAVDIVGTALKGFAGLTTDNPRRVQEVEQGLATMGQMDDAQFADFVARIPENMDINPIAAINYQMAARAARKGEKQTASEYLETARKSTNTAPLEEQQAYKLGEKVQGSVAGDEFKPRPGWEKSITVQLGQAGGSMAAFVPLSILGGPAASGIFGVSAGSGEAVENAEQALGTSTRDDRAGPYNAGLGAGADEQVLRAGKLGVAPGATDAIPVEALVQRLPQMIPGLRQVAKSGGWDRFSKMVGQIVTQMAIEGGQEAGQQYLQNLIQQLTLVPEKDLTEDMLQSFLIGGAVGGIAEAPVAGYEAAVGGREGAPAPDAGTPPPDKQPAPTPNTATKADMEAPTPDKTAASADIAPTPMSGPEQAALLAGAGYTLEDVRSMTPEEYRRTIEELRQQGATAKPGAELQSEKPKPGTAPMAPKLKKQGPDIELPVVPGWPIQEETAAPIEDYSADTDLESYIDDAVRSGVAPDQVAKEMAEAGAPEGAIAYTTRRMARLAAEQTPPTGELSETSVQLPEPLDFSGESIDPGDGTRAKPAKVADESDMQAARDLVASEPTEAQKEAGNYKKGHVKVHGLDITLETPKGGKRTGKNPDGTEWSVDMQDDYGYVKRTEGADGEQVDVFLGPNHGSSRAFIVNQVDPETGKFDEHKIVLGADHERQARNIYERAFSDGSGDRRMGGMEEMDVSQLKDWLATPQTEPASAKTPEAGPETAPEPAIGYTSAPDDDFDAAFDQAVAEQFDAPQGRKEPGLPAVKDRLIVQVGSRRFEAESLAQASQAYTDTVDATGSTSSGQTGPAAPKAIILDKDGNQIAHIAYNGRVWAGKAEDWKSGDTPLYDPRKSVSPEPEPGDMYEANLKAYLAGKPLPHPEKIENMQHSGLWKGGKITTNGRMFLKDRAAASKAGQKKGKEKQPVKPAVDEESRGDEKIVHPDTSVSPPTNRSKKGSKPLSLLQFIAWNGGIREEKGEMAARNLEKKFLPGFGRLVRKNGKSHASVLESAIQEGYLSDPSRVDGSESQVTVNDLYAAIDAEHGGKPVYADARDAQVAQEKTEAKQVKQTEQELERYSPDERSFIEKHGFEIFEDMHIAMTRHDLTWTDWTPDALDAAGRLMKGGMDAMDALERGATSLETPEAVELANDQEADIPYDDEVLEGTASEGGEGLRASGAEDQGPRDEGAPREVRQESEEPGQAGQPAERGPLSPFVDRVRALLDQDEIEKPEIYALVKDATIEDLPALHELAKENADWDWLGALDMVVDELRDKVVPPLYSPGGNSKKKLAEYEARKEQAAAAKAKFQPTYDLIKEKRAAAIVRTMEETGFRPGDVVEFTDTVIDTRDGHEMKRAVRGPIAYRDGDTHAQIHDQGGVLFLTPTDFRQYLKKSAPADEFDAAFDAAVDLQFGDDGTVQPFDPARHIKLVADDVSKVRKPDLERLFDEAPKDRDAWHDLRVYLIDNRPELAGDVFDAMDIVGIPVEEESSAAKQERTDRRARLKEKAQRIYDFVANGGKVAFTTHTKHVPIKDTSVLQIRDDGLYVARGKQWDYVLEPQLDQMLTLLPKVRAKAPNLRRGRERIENDISLFQQVAAEGQSPAQRERGRKRVEELKAELAALPTEESGADNKPQTVIPGAEKIGDAKLAQRRADAPLRPQVVQKPIESGLFGDERNQTDLLDRLPPKRAKGTFESLTPEPTFYSALLRTVESLKQAKAPAAQWLGMIRNAPGVKKEELDWIGLEEWLNAQSGSIEKAAVADFIRANQVQVQEVVQGDKPGRRDDVRPTVTAAAPLMPEWDRLSAEINQKREDLRQAIQSRNEGERQRLRDELDGLEDAREALHARMVDATIKEIGGLGKPTKFAEYTLPGGENYREILLTLPEQNVFDPSKVTWKRKCLSATQGSVELFYDGKRLGTFDDSPRMHSAPFDFRSDEELVDIVRRRYGGARELGIKPLDGGASFRSTHFEEPNILAHVRFNERKDADGKRVLFIEEIQSDWHQAGRKGGYDTKRVSPERRSELLVERDRLAGEAEKIQSRRKDDAVKRGLTGQAYSDYAYSDPEWIARMERITAINDEIGEHTGRVPDAPFKTTWPELAMKRMIRWAAENGFDRIAWTPGDVQAGRYDLSQHVDVIRYARSADGNYDIEIDMKDGGTRQEPNLSIERVEELIGKDLAKKVEADEGKSGARATETNAPMKGLSGLDLKIGGEGMRAFYDRELVNIANKLGKKFGAKVGTTKVSAAGGKPTAYADFDAYQRAKEEPFEVHAMDISPSMREGAMRGQPLFRLSNRFRDDIDAAERAEIVRTVQLLANQIFGRSLRLGVVDELENGSQGRFDPNVNAVIVALRASLNPVETLGHEAIHGLRNIGAITKPEWAAIARWAREAVLPTFKDAQRYRDFYGARHPDLTPAHLDELVLEEAIAEYFGRFLASDPSIQRQTPRAIGAIFARLHEFLTRVRNYLAGAGFRTPADIFAGIAKGEKRNAPVQESSREFDLESLPDYVGEAQSKAIDEVLAGARPRPRTPIMFRTVPRVLAALGVKDTPVAVAPSVVWKAVDKHGMTGAQVKAALNGLADPMVVFDSATEAGAFVAVVEVAGLDGLAAIAIHPGETVGRIEISRIASIHDRPAAQVFNWLDHGLARYFNKRKTDAWLRSAGLQLPGDGSVRHRLGKKVLRFGDVFKGAAPATKSGSVASDPDPNAQSVPERDSSVDGRSKGGKGTFESLGRMPPSRGQSSFVEPDDDPISVLNNQNLPLLARISGASANATLGIRRALQDRMADWRRVEKAIEEQTGPVNPALSVYRAETLYAGRAGERMEELRNDVVEPLIEDMAARGVTEEMLDLYLYARHAPERNAYIASINSQMPDGGSGMTNADAAQVMADFRKNGTLADLAAVAQRVDALQAETRQRLVREGVIDRQTYNQWNSFYKHYVPLRGFEADPDADARPSTGRRFDARSKVDQQALGRRSKADSPLAYAIAAAQQSIILGEKARVGRAVLSLARSFPNPNLWEVEQVPPRRYISQATGLVTTVPDNARRKLAENVIAVRVGGNLYYVTLHHRGLLAGVKGSEAVATPAPIRALASIGRYLALMRTGLDPQFFIPNFIRDLGTAGIHIGGDQGATILRRVLKDIPKAMRGAWQGSRGNFASQWAQEYRDFGLAGGKTGTFGLEDIETIKKRVVRDLWLARPGGGRAALRGGKVLLDFMMDVNGAVENAVRLSLYVNLRRAGHSQDAAAAAAKEVTVNFNRKGEWGVWLNAAYLFANANIQGTARIARALATSKVARRAAFGLFLTGVALDLMNALISGDSDDDDEDDYDQIPEHVRERNFVIMIPGGAKGERLQIPMPWVYNVFHYAGTNVGRMIRGKVKPMEAAANIGGAALQAGNPLQAYSWLQMVSPTILDPFVELKTNEDWKGDQIVPGFGKMDKRPQSQRYSPNINPIYREITDYLNSATGGDEVRPGSIDVSPESIEYIVQFIGGGVGTTTNNLMSTVTGLVSGAEVDLSKVPFLRKVFSEHNAAFGRGQYYDIVEAVELTGRQFKNAVREGDAETLAAIRRDYAADLKIAPMVKQVKAMIKTLRGLESSTPDMQRKIELRAKINDLMAKVRARYKMLQAPDGES